MSYTPRPVGLNKKWRCPACAFSIPVAPKEKGPRHCPKCYKKGGLQELKKKKMKS